jgi:hypothetical protein
MKFMVLPWSMYKESTILSLKRNKKKKNLWGNFDIFTWLFCIINNSWDILVFFTFSFQFFQKSFSVCSTPMSRWHLHHLGGSCDTQPDCQIWSSVISADVQLFSLSYNVVRVDVWWSNCYQWSFLFVFSFLTLSWQLKYIIVISVVWF